MKLLLFFLLPSMILCTNSSDPFRTDGSERLIQYWLDNFHRALAAGNKEQIKALFTPDAIMYSCEREPEIRGKWKPKLRTKDALRDYMIENRSEIRMVLNFSDFLPGRQHIKAALSIFGFGPPHLAPISFLIHDGKVYFGFTEYLACGMATLNRC